MKKQTHSGLFFVMALGRSENAARDAFRAYSEVCESAVLVVYCGYRNSETMKPMEERSAGAWTEKSNCTA